MVVRSGFPWWFSVVVRGGFSPKISRKRSCDPLFNQSQNQIHYEISFLMRLLICPFPFNQSQNQIHYEISFLMRLLICPFPFKEHTSKELC